MLWGYNIYRFAFGNLIQSKTNIMQTAPPSVKGKTESDSAFQRLKNILSYKKNMDYHLDKASQQYKEAAEQYTAGDYAKAALNTSQANGHKIIAIKNSINAAVTSLFNNQK
jgi:hypothetical protein